MITAPKLPVLKPLKITQFIPTETQTHEAFIRWVELSKTKYPELHLLFHSPNGGYRSKTSAAQMQRLGTRAGVPDIILPVARGSFIGLAIEFKRKNTGRASAAQTDYMDRLITAGWLVAICTCHTAAAKTVCDYLRLPNIDRNQFQSIQPKNS